MDAATRGRPDERILVVEDDADVRAYVVETLGSLGYHVLEAAGANEAFQLLDQHQAIDLLPREWPQARGRGQTAASGLESGVHDGIFAKCHRAPGSSRSRRHADTKTAHERASGRCGAAGSR